MVGVNNCKHRWQRRCTQFSKQSVNVGRYLRQVVESVDLAKMRGLDVPFLEGLVRVPEFMEFAAASAWQSGREIKLAASASACGASDAALGTRTRLYGWAS